MYEPEFVYNHVIFCPMHFSSYPYTWLIYLHCYPALLPFGLIHFLSFRSASLSIRVIFLCPFLPLGRKAEGVLLWACPSLRRHFTFLAVQGAFLHQLSLFLVCGLVIRLFCGSFNDFEKISFFGSKTAKLGTENMHF